VQARERDAVTANDGEPAERLADADLLAAAHRGDDRLVRRAGAVGMGHHDHTAPSKEPSVGD
jgi:hypothetical protein